MNPLTNQSPHSSMDSSRPLQQSLFGLGLIGFGLFCLYVLFPKRIVIIESIVPNAIMPLAALAMLILGYILPIIGLAFYAQGRGRQQRWCAVALLPFAGPILGLAAISLDDLLRRISTPTLIRRTAMGLIIILVPLSILAVFIPNFLRYCAKSRSSEARTNLGGAYVAETSYYQQHKRYGNFDDIGFGLAGTSNRYTYRIDRSGAPGTIIPSGIGKATPDNTRVPAGIATDPPGFTITATANLDNDDTIDQWHLNDAKRGLHRADVDDITQ